jgi:hypothetical protein
MAAKDFRVEAIFPDGTNWIITVQAKTETEALKIGTARAKEIDARPATVRLALEQY